jgi:uncharacterized protein
MTATATAWRTRNRSRRSAERPVLRVVNWVVKVSKLCNLRCRYCYEWNELDRRERISLDQWDHLLSAIRRYHTLQAERHGEPFRTTIIWHGGEPLVQPMDYLTKVFDRQHAILADLLDSGRVVNALQTNLYRITDKQIELLRRERVELGVSCDVASGVRLTIGDRTSEDQVVDNMDRVRAAGIGFGAIVVLAGHTAPRITDIYDFYHSLGVRVRFLPLFAAPLNGPEAPFVLSAVEAEAALQRLFVHWVGKRGRTPTLPLHDYLGVVLRHRRRETTWRYDRSLGEWAFIVNTDGSLYQTHEAYHEPWALGNVFEQTIDQVIASPAHAASLRRDRALAARVCGGCAWESSCSMLPAFDGSLAGPQTSRCHYGYAHCQFIDEYFTQNHYSLDQISRLAQ